MKNRSWLLISLLLAAGAAHAQLYRWVGPDGKVTYSDTPPPSSARQVEKKDAPSGGPSTTGLPYELAQAVKANPVTLYTTTQCSPCEDARTMLKTRGIPYAEKTVVSNDDIAKLKQIAGDQQLPFLTVGSRKQKGFESNSWDVMLSAAGYPQSSRLPPDYRNPPPEPAAPKAKPSAAPATAAVERPAGDALPDTPPPAGNAPPGFRF